ncbi:MAG: formate dehydrogenase subunit alpha [Planctomycetota bacterium]|nr:MAG: formate dehydrogenase subunit alpha [Planctomycetota bacterium]
MKDVLTTCAFCGCGCGLYLQIEKGYVTGVTPSQRHPVSRGRLCARGWHIYEFVHHPDRLKKPLVREGGAFREVDWREALDMVAKNLIGIKDKYGSDSIGVIASPKCTNEDNFVLMKFCRAVLGTNNIDNGASLYDSASLPGLMQSCGFGASTNSLNELEDTEVILAVGTDTTQTHPQVASRITRAISSGATLIVIDPQKTKISSFANVHLRLKQGTYVGLINGIIHIILKEGLINEKDVSRATSNLDSLKKMVEKYTPDYVSELCGISGSDLAKAARLFAKADKAMTVYSTGATAQAAGKDIVCALANLALLCGHLGRPHNGIITLQEQNNALGAADMGTLPDFYPGYQPVNSETERAKFESEWNTKLPAKPGLSILEMLSPGRLKALYIMGENPLITAPDVGLTSETLDGLEFLVVQDIFQTETAEFADAVLPAASFAEKDGTFTNIERRVQRVRAAVSSPGEALPDWKIITELSKRMGYTMDYGSPAQIMEEISHLTPIYTGISHKRLDEEWGLQWPCPDKEHPGTGVLRRDFYEGPKAIFPLIEQNGKGKEHFTPVQDIPLMEPPDAQYPFTLTTGSLYWHWHSGTMTRRSATLSREYPDVFAAINPQDAEQLGIRKNQRIRVISKRGEMETAAMITDRVQVKTVFIPQHYKNTASKVLLNPSSFTNAKASEMFCAVRVEPVMKI